MARQLTINKHEVIIPQIALSLLWLSSSSDNVLCLHLRTRHINYFFCIKVLQLHRHIVLWALCNEDWSWLKCPCTTLTDRLRTVLVCPFAFVTTSLPCSLHCIISCKMYRYSNNNIWINVKVSVILIILVMLLIVKKDMYHNASRKGVRPVTCSALFEGTLRKNWWVDKPH